MQPVNVSISVKELANLRTAHAALGRFLKMVDEANIVAPVSLSRGPDGIHLDEEGVSALYSYFDQGGTAYGAKKKFGIAYRAAKLRYDMWSKAQVAA